MSWRPKAAAVSFPSGLPSSAAKGQGLGVRSKRTVNKPATIDADLATVPDDARAALEKVRSAIHAAEREEENAEVLEQQTSG